MLIDFKNPFVRKPLLTILFYIVSGITLWFITTSFPGDPCNPGIALFSIFFVLILIVVLFFINLYKTLSSDRSNLFSMLAHLFVIIYTVIYEISLP